MSLSDEDSDDEARSVVTFKLKDYLDKRTTQKFVNGINRMCILGYFRCLEPEPRSIKKKCLPKLQGPEQDMVDAFNKILSSLPDHISQKINELHEEAKRFFEDY
ncbi:hypothetical protein FOCC_FOCC017189 [Frankliniella occidentalis]|nr:hypothetical protein FOCC_FOCC017189 [Frankliniella occidentalis]